MTQLSLRSQMLEWLMLSRPSQNILIRQRELEEFLRELEEIRKDPGHKLSPLAGVLEKQELDKINKILKAMGYPT